MKGKPKKGFASGSGGKSSLNAQHKSSIKTPTIQDSKEPLIKDKVVEDDEDLNSGFGSYLRSPEAAEMMKLFVIANSIVIILTKAWPSMQETYKMFEEWWFYKSL